MHKFSHENEFHVHVDGHEYINIKFCAPSLTLKKRLETIHYSLMAHIVLRPLKQLILSKLVEEIDGLL